MSCQGSLMGRGAHSDAPLIAGYGEDAEAALSDGVAVFDPRRPERALEGRRGRRGGGSPSHEMLSERGGAQVEVLVTAAAELAAARELSRGEVVEAVAAGVETIAEAFPEATDLEVRASISESLRDPFSARGWKPVHVEELPHPHPE